MRRFLRGSGEAVFWLVVNVSVIAAYYLAADWLLQLGR